MLKKPSETGRLFFLKASQGAVKELSLIFSTYSKATTVGTKRLLSVLFTGGWLPPKKERS